MKKTFLFAPLFRTTLFRTTLFRTTLLHTIIFWLFQSSAYAQISAFGAGNALILDGKITFVSFLYHRLPQETKDAIEGWRKESSIHSDHQAYHTKGLDPLSFDDFNAFTKNSYSNPQATLSEDDVVRDLNSVKKKINDSILRSRVSQFIQDYRISTKVQPIIPPGIDQGSRDEKNDPATLSESKKEIVVSPELYLNNRGLALVSILSLLGNPSINKKGLSQADWSDLIQAIYRSNATPLNQAM